MTMTVDSGDLNQSLVPDVGDLTSAPERPLVSIVIGSFNRRRFLERTIESLRANGARTPHELIVVDGGSTDGSLEWLVRQKDIITIVQHNRGEFRGAPIRRRSWGYFMNLGFKSAQGRYILMLSDDCLLVPGAIDRGVARFSQLEGEGRRIGGVAFYYRNWPDERDYYVQLTLGGKLMVNHGMYARSAMESVGWVEEDRYQFYKADGDLSLKMWEAGFEVADCPGAYVEHEPGDPQVEPRAAHPRPRGVPSALGGRVLGSGGAGAARSGRGPLRRPVPHRQPFPHRRARSDGPCRASGAPDDRASTRAAGRTCSCMTAGETQH
jgi:GT2 family glycosyltransferase